MTTHLWSETDASIGKFLDAGGYRNLNEWATDSGYAIAYIADVWDWVDLGCPEFHVDIWSCLHAAMEAEEESVLAEEDL